MPFPPRGQRPDVPRSADASQRWPPTLRSGQPLLSERRPATSGPVPEDAPWPQDAPPFQTARVQRRSRSPSQPPPFADAVPPPECWSSPGFRAPPASSSTDAVPRSLSPAAPSTVLIDVSGCRYSVVADAARAIGWCCASPGQAAQVYWLDTSVSGERVKRLARQPGAQRLNHFPGMDAISRKAPLSRTIDRVRKCLPRDYDFFPQTFLDYREYLLHRQAAVMQDHRNGVTDKRYYIVKPSSGCMGKGIYLTPNPTPEAFGNGSVVQDYVARPLLIDGRKFDLRVYVLVVSVTPPIIYFYKEGMLRLCAEQYVAPRSSNEECLCVHLTNYAVNKKHDGFGQIGDGTTGGKRSLRYLDDWLAGRGRDPALFWQSVHDVCVKTVLAAAGPLQQQYRSCVPEGTGPKHSLCFELLGFDILVDQTLKPWLVEVNHSPSLVTETQLDYNLKLGLVSETLGLLGARVPGTRRQRSRSRHAAAPNWLQVYPCGDADRQAVYEAALRHQLTPGSGHGVPRVSAATAQRCQARQRAGRPQLTRSQTGSPVPQRRQLHRAHTAPSASDCGVAATDCGVPPQSAASDCGVAAATTTTSRAPSLRSIPPPPLPKQRSRARAPLTPQQSQSRQFASHASDGLSRSLQPRPGPPHRSSWTDQQRPPWGHGAIRQRGFR